MGHFQTFQLVLKRVKFSVISKLLLARYVAALVRVFDGDDKRIFALVVNCHAWDSHTKSVEVVELIKVIMVEVVVNDLGRRLALTTDRTLTHLVTIIKLLLSLRESP